MSGRKSTGRQGKQGNVNANQGQGQGKEQRSPQEPRQSQNQRPTQQPRQPQNQRPPQEQRQAQNQRQPQEPRQPRPRSSSSSCGGDKDNCNVCYRRYPETKYHSIGACDHSICFECSVRMRVLLEQNECPSCRQVLDNVVITHEIKPYKEVQGQLRMYTFIPKFGIYIEDEEIKQAFDELLEHRCFLCEGKNAIFNTFSALKHHVQREHELFCCDLCVENIKHFPRERKFYSRADLAYHKRKGDKNDTSHRGHPLCQFCDVRFFDPDHLFKHLRRDHYFCHFCDADGYNHYYNTYDDLRVHFRKEHYLCEEENCAAEKFTSVFRTDIDLKAHLTTAHSRLLGKHGTKQARQLDVEFVMRPNDEDRRGRFGRPEHRYNRTRDRERMDEQNDEPPPSSEPEFQPPIVKPQIDSARDFPTLGEAPVKNGVSTTPTTAPRESQVQGYSPGALGQVQVPRQPAQTISSRIAPTWNAKTKLEDDFPVLAGVTDSVAQLSLKSKAFSSNSQPVPAQQKKPQEDFPALPSQGKIWAGPRPSTKTPKGAGKKAAPAPELPKPEFNYIPLYKERTSTHNGFKAPVPSPPASPQPIRVNHVSDPEAGSKKKKKQMSEAAAALFNGGNLPSRTNGSSSEPKLPKRPQNTEEDFPSLQPAPSARKPILPKPKVIPKPKPQPPPRKISPPPGFSLISPPRGSNSTGDSPVKPPPGFELGPKKIGLYLQPVDYSQRHERLMQGINTSFNSDSASLEIFNSLSAQFKKGETEPREYYEMCQDMFGISDFRVIFPELIVLLTDIRKQQDLFQVHKKLGGSLSNLRSCYECGQVLKSTDISYHMRSHSGIDPFPSL